MSRKIILNIYTAFADQLKINYQSPLDDENLKALISDLDKKDKNIKAVISSYDSALASLSFIEKEKEMRIKFPDICMH